MAETTETIETADTIVYPEIPSTPIIYPESDGKPMAETDTHRDDLIYAVESLKQHFREREDVYVSGNLLVYYQEGQPTKSFAPDCFVVFGVPKRRRRTYKIWQEGRAPDVVVEFTSNSTKADDAGSKKGLYAFLGVREYYLFDPTGDYLPVPLVGYRLEGDTYVAQDPVEDGALESPLLNMRLVPEGELLRFIRLDTGEPLPLYGEAVEVARRQQERAEAETQRAESESQRAEAEARRADAAEQRVAELLTELARLRGEG
jgi:Uma2 family endonuclease